MIWEILGLVGGLILALFGLVFSFKQQRAKGREEGRQESERKGLADAARRTEEGRRAVLRGRTSGDTPADRLRQNDGQW
jgi:beta-lactamase regulating signal transducer with metallopeptidase domain